MINYFIILFHQKVRTIKYNIITYIVLTDNLLSTFISNDNKKIIKLLNRLLTIYSHSIGRIKLEYFFRYYQKAILSKYLNFKKAKNIFKKRNLKYNKILENSKNNVKSVNFELLKMPSCPYSLNRSQPFIFTPQLNNKNIAFLMTPCYIIDNDENIIENVSSLKKDFLINGNYLSCPKKKKIFYRTNSEILNDSPFYMTYMNTSRKKNFFTNKYK